jgi:hypothetical protein
MPQAGTRFLAGFCPGKQAVFCHNKSLQSWYAADDFSIIVYYPAERRNVQQMIDKKYGIE